MATNPPTANRRRRFWKLARIVGYLIVIWLVVSLGVAYKLTRRRDRPFAEPTPVVTWTKFEPGRLQTKDGHEIGTWFAQGRDDAPSMILIHGNGGQRRHVLGRAELLAREGCSVLLISLRAHGDSTGEFNDIGFGARNDVVAAVEFLEKRRPRAPIVILGTSLGGAAALFAAQELGHRVGGYIVESPYRDLKVAVWNRTENGLPPVLDWIAYRGLLAVSPLVLPHLEEISPHDAITQVPLDVPILILAGDEDISARREEAEALFDRARSHARLHIFPKTGHIQMIETNPERYRRAVFELLEQACPSWHPRRSP